MAGFCEVSCVKYCVFTLPLVVATVQTHGGVQSALRSIHAPTRDEEGTYIRASVASDIIILSTPNTPSHQGMMMNIFLLGGWVARPSAFYFVAFLYLPCLRCLLGRSVFCCRLACSIYSLLCLVSRIPLCLLLSLCLTVPSLALAPCSLVQPNRTLSPMFLNLVCLAFPPCLV